MAEDTEETTGREGDDYALARDRVQEVQSAIEAALAKANQ